MSGLLEFSQYHKVLRVLCVVVATILVFDSGFLAPVTARLSDQTQQYLASAIGVTVGVPENDVNRLTTRIAELESALNTQSQVLNERSLAVGLQTTDTSSQTSVYVLSGILFILLLLIVLNYVLDFYRSRRMYAATKERSIVV
jgi:predicted PurR-regulated permease PerM